ncbi:Mpp10 protein-domain-containing protein [Coniella lustricola]|uniref:Mpp10 protein-domain-containing protein n=1 Tax=Coniella lustricola TaxID=2025994 RepID=A0A2T3A437_9PEZI|nr:Mpp10 protein-domain-containing protein [Coniella lustricola]
MATATAAAANAAANATEGSSTTSSSLASTTQTLTHAVPDFFTSNIHNYNTSNGSSHHPNNSNSSHNNNDIPHNHANNLMAALAASPREAASMLAFLDALKPENRHAFLQPPPALSTASLHWAKHALDAFAGQVGDEQAARRSKDKKRKREEGGSSGDVLKIRRVHVEGFETGQVWQQARRIIQSTLQTSQNVLVELEANGLVVGKDGAAAAAARESLSSANDEEALSQDEEDDGDSEDSDSGAEKWEDAESQQFDGLSDAEDDDGMEDLGDQDDAALGDEDDDSNDDDLEDKDDFDDQPTATYVEDPNGLNDGFFSIDDFNKQSQWFEEQDYKADPQTDQASEDENIDWHGDPFSEPKGKPKSKDGKGGEDDGDSDAEAMGDDEDDAGPTFGDMDLDAPEGASDDEAAGDLADGLVGDMGLDLTANDVFYKDFFAPPPRKAKKGDKPRKFQPRPREEPDEHDMEVAMGDVRRDLFEDMSEQSDDEDALSDVSAGNPKSRRSAHERRQAKLSEEISRMESELVAKRAWTLSGEASAATRPVNSLLEENLDFEHAGKPITVITEEVSEELEELIKRRVIAGEFDEVIKRRPDSDGPADVRRGLVEVDDSKAKQSLAELYEEEHIKNANPDTYVSAKDEKSRKEEKEIERMWKDVSAKLDALSSWHYKPKPAAPSLTVVADVATVTMEDAQPTTAQGVSGGESMIAPQEVYAPGKDTAEQGEVVAKSGVPIAREEMSREDKARRRRQEKQRIRKAGGDTTKLSKKAQEKKDTLANLKQGGVKVINRKGEVLDMEGNKAQDVKAVSSNSLKL